MSIGINWADVWGPVWGPVWSTTPPVAVPDVVGLDQAAATAALEDDGFAVAVVTAASSTVAAGLVISQEPAAGASASTGSTVTITVSTGDAGVDPLDKKFLARPNVRIKGLQGKKRKEEPAPVEPAPLPTEVPEPRKLARGLDAGVLPQPPAPVQAPPVAPPVEVKAKTPVVAPAAEPQPTPAPTPVAPTPAPPTPPALDPKVLLEGVQALLAHQEQRFAAQLGEMSAALVMAADEIRQLRQDQKIRDQKVRNLERAAEITRKLLED